MTLQQIKNDPRVSEVEKPDGSDCKYFLWLNDGWVFDDESHMIPCDTVKEMSDALKYEVKKEKKE